MIIREITPSKNEAVYFFDITIEELGRHRLNLSGIRLV